MSKGAGPGLFSDIGKKARDILSKDYISDHKISVSTYTHTGLAFTSSCVKKGGLSAADVATQYKYKNTTFDIKVDTSSNIATTITVTDIFPSTKTIASLKYPHYESGKLDVQYVHPHASLTSGVALTGSPTVDFSFTLGTSTFRLGAEASYDSSSSKLIKYTAGISVTNPDSCASITLGDKGDSIKASYIKQMKKSCGVGEISRRFSTNDNTITVGGSYEVDHLTLVKVKLDSNGTMAGLLQHEVFPKSILTMATEFDTKALDKTPKFGVSFALKP